MFEQKTTESSVSVTLSANSFDDSTYVVRVPRKTLDLDNIVSDICGDYPSLDPYVINHSAELLKSQILKYLKAGKAVNILELGTMYLAPKGTVGRANPQVSDLPGLTLKFTPSKTATEALSGLSADSFMISDPAPQITKIISLKDGSEDGNLEIGSLVRLTGNKLKVSGDNSGVFLVPANDDGSPNTDDSTWTAADASYLPRNTAKTLEFYIPSTAQPGNEYFIAVRTAYLSGSTTRKEAVTGYSADVVLIS